MVHFETVQLYDRTTPDAGYSNKGKDAYDINLFILVFSYQKTDTEALYTVACTIPPGHTFESP